MGNYYVVYRSDELAHWGIKGMKWGVRRYQNPDGSLTAAGKKRYYKMDEDKREKWLEKLSSKNKSIAKKETARKDIDETTAAERKAREDAEKERVLSSGTATEVMKYRGRLTVQELEAVKKRLDAENNIKRLADAEAAEIEAIEQAKIDKGIAKTKEAITKLNQGIEIAQGAAKTWNMFANTFNAFSGGDLPTISTEITKGSNKNNKDGNDGKDGKDGKKSDNGNSNIRTDVDWIMKNLNSATDADIVNAKKRLNEISGLRKAYDYEVEGRKKEAEADKQAVEAEEREKKQKASEKKLADDMKEREKARAKLREKAAKEALETPDAKERLDKNFEEIKRNNEEQRRGMEAAERLMNDPNLRILNWEYD